MILNIIMLGIGLSMDAFSVSISNGLCIHNIRKKDAFKTGIYFGAAQGIMPLIGYYGGIIFAERIERIDHWVVFVLLSFIGIKMIFEALKEIKNPSGCGFASLSHKALLIQAIATSIDALAVGVSFAAINVNVYLASSIIALTTFCFSFVGVFIGKKVGSVFKEKAEIFGGIVLIFIGIKILAEHLFF